MRKDADGKDVPAPLGEGRRAVHPPDARRAQRGRDEPVVPADAARRRPLRPSRVA